MDNQHKKISGYRDLSQAEIDLMNKIKAKGEELRALIAEINAVAIPPLQAAQTGELVEGVAVENEGDSPGYWLRFADSSFRTGVMYAVRAVAKPASY